MTTEQKAVIVITAGVAQSAFVGTISLALGLSVVWPGMVFSLLFGIVSTALMVGKR